LVWNRRRFIKDPNTGKRVSRPNPEAKWIRTEVPELRIVDDELWQRVKQRQAELAKQPSQLSNLPHRLPSRIYSFDDRN
jgi:site-specific DNA recombinase